MLTGAMVTYSIAVTKSLIATFNNNDFVGVTSALVRDWVPTDKGAFESFLQIIVALAL